MVDIRYSKEECIQMIDGFVRSVDGQEVASVILDLDSRGWTSVLGVYFNLKHYILNPPEEEFESEDEDAQEARVV